MMGREEVGRLLSPEETVELWSRARLGTSCYDLIGSVTIITYTARICYYA